MIVKEVEKRDYAEEFSGFGEGERGTSDYAGNWSSGGRDNEREDEK